MTRVPFRQADIERIIRAAKTTGALSTTTMEVKHQGQKQNCRNTGDTGKRRISPEILCLADALSKGTDNLRGNKQRQKGESKQD